MKLPCGKGEINARRVPGRNRGARRNKAVRYDLILPVVQVDLDTVDACVAKHFGIKTAALKEHGRRAGPAKAVAVELACRLTGQSGRAASAGRPLATSGAKSGKGPSTSCPLSNVWCCNSEHEAEEPRKCKV